MHLSINSDVERNFVIVPFFSSAYYSHIPMNFYTNQFQALKHFKERNGARGFLYRYVRGPGLLYKCEAKDSIGLDLLLSLLWALLGCWKTKERKMCVRHDSVFRLKGKENLMRHTCQRQKKLSFRPL